MTTKDYELADFTDNLLKTDTAMDIQTDHLNADEHMVLKLQQLIRPSEPIEPELQQKLTRAINIEWERTKVTRQRQTTKPETRAFRLPFRLNNVQMAAAGIIIAVVAVAVLLTGTQPDASSTAGTASGSSDDLTIFLILGGIGVILGVGWVMWTRRK